ncbi:hypothetical protein L483_20650 [Pseudomonas putida H8234]|nr:hypothetical protein L483_20650 [Pseudomonas putida H8234]
MGFSLACCKHIGVTVRSMTASAMRYTFVSDASSKAIANLREQRRGQTMFRDDVEILEDDFGVATDDFFGDTVRG